jgi:hypothetical protein
VAANRTNESSSRRWAGYGAAVAAFSFAVVSVYWGLGGVWGIDTLGGDLATRARARDPVLLGLNWAAAVLKVAGGILALALVQSWGRRLPDRPLIMTARAGAVLLIIYGTVQTAGVLLVRLGVVRLADPVEPDVILWRLLLWEPWFLVWGLLLGATVWPRGVLNQP